MSAARPSLRRAINDKCRDCIYDPLAGGAWRQQVESCTCTDCPLYQVRPRTLARESGRNGPKIEHNGDVLSEASA